MCIRDSYISVLFLTGMTACAKEDTLTPEVDTNIDCFAPAADAMDEESVLRRTFFEQENCYLLFSDTLRREELGKDSNGDMQYFIELWDAVSYTQLDVDKRQTFTPTICP